MAHYRHQKPHIPGVKRSLKNQQRLCSTTLLFQTADWKIKKDTKTQQPKTNNSKVHLLLMLSYQNCSPLNRPTAKNQDATAKNQDGDDQKPRWRQAKTKMATRKINGNQQQITSWQLLYKKTPTTVVLIFFWRVIDVSLSSICNFPLET